jgi:hypothetical protein
MSRTRRGVFWRGYRACGLTIGGSAIMAASLGGCSYFETLSPPADNRIQLVPADGEIYLGRREARNYTCAGHLILHCHDRSPTDLACGCVDP